MEAAIEAAAGPQVIRFMSGNKQAPDIMCQVFTLTPIDLVDATELDAGEHPPEPRSKAATRSPYA